MSSRLILASTSPSRQAQMAAAGVDVDIVGPDVDEDPIKQDLRASGASAQTVAEALADAKALAVSRRCPGRLVLGADQVLAIGSDMLDKPRDMAEAAGHLRRLRGRAHALLSAATICADGVAVWRFTGHTRLEMRHVSDAFIADYLAIEGERLLKTVGAYRLEGRGAQLFTRVEGDYFSVLGLPLLELLAFLRSRGLCAA